MAREEAHYWFEGRTSLRHEIDMGLLAVKLPKAKNGRR